MFVDSKYYLTSQNINGCYARIAISRTDNSHKLIQVLYALVISSFQTFL